MRWRIDLEYDGAGFAGWQVQPGQRTVQGTVADALARTLGEAVDVSGAGRTDAGVHAKQQVASFVTSVDRDARGMVGGLNAHLPDDLACWFAAPVPDAFDPRRTPHTKRYVYTWLDRPVRSPLVRGRAWHLRQRLDHAAMAEAVVGFGGTHDFSSFRAAGCASEHPVRTLEHAEVVRDGDLVHLALHGTGFLRHMVRIVAGTLVEVGRGTRDPTWLVGVRDAQDREAAGRTAPPEGLCLEWIRYREPEARSPKPET